MEFETLDISRDGYVTTVTLNRPDRLNAMNAAMFREIGEAFRWIDAETDTRAVVLAGNGKHFTAGLDLKENAEVFDNSKGDPARIREKFRRHVLYLQDCFTAIEECRAPVISATHGACVGAGIDVISACDIRVASKDCFFSIQEINVAIVADVGTLQRMPYLLPNGILRELAYTGRKFFVDEAEKYGFTNHITDDRESAIAKATEIAKEIASKSPLAVSGTKAIINYSRDHTVKDSLDYVATWNSGQLMGEDLMKAATAVMTRQTVEFDDLIKEEH